MKTKLILLSVFLLTAALALTLTASAAIPHLMNFQGKATDKSGAPLNGSYNLTFRIYNIETGGTPKWSETQSNISISNGIFQVQLGSVTALNLPFDESYWISIEINTDGEMSPRTRLASVGYAYMAEKANNTNMPVGSVVQVVTASSTATISCPRVISATADTIPTTSNGTLLSALDLTITPTSATSTLLIQGIVNLGPAGAGDSISVAMFKNAATNATTGWTCSAVSVYYMESIPIYYTMAAGGTNAITFHFYAGAHNSVAYLNANGYGTRIWGGVAISNVSVTEIKG